MLAGFTIPASLQARAMVAAICAVDCGHLGQDVYHGATGAASLQQMWHLLVDYAEVSACC